MNYEMMWKHLKSKMNCMLSYRDDYVLRSDWDSLLYKISRVERDLLRGLIGTMESVELSERNDDMRKEFYENIGRESEEKDNVDNN